VRWDPEQYLRFADHRGRPFHDLLARVAALAPDTVVDLGCGPGNLTVELADRWPQARVQGIDNSPQMIDKVRAGARSGVRFTRADLVEWAPDEPVDVLVSNATLQWVPGHLQLLDRLVSMLRSGGWLAFQVPGNFGEPSHTELAAVCAAPRRRQPLGDAPIATGTVHQPATYLARLAGLGLTVDAWETTYLHVLPGRDAVLEWMRGLRCDGCCRGCRARMRRSWRPSTASGYAVPSPGRSTVRCCRSEGSSRLPGSGGGD